MASNTDKLEDKIVVDLVDKWQEIHDVTEPSNLGAADSLDVNLAELSFISSREEFWKVMASLTGFTAGFTPEATVRFARSLTQSVPQPHPSMNMEYFLDYAENYLDLPRDSIKAALNVILRVVPADKFTDLFTIMGTIQECLRKHPNDVEKFKECLLS